MPQGKLRYILGHRLSKMRRMRVKQMWEALPDASYLSPLLGEEPVPRDGEPVYAFAFCGEQLVGFCEIYEAAEEGLELRGMVAPEYRRQGIFTELVNQLCEGRPGPFFFVGTEEQESFRCWATAMGLGLVERDLLMGASVAEVHRPQSVPTKQQDSSSEGVPKTSVDGPPEIVIEEQTQDAGDTEQKLRSMSVSAYLGEENVGGLYCLIEREAFVFDVWVEEAKRRQGIAGAMLAKLVAHLPQQMRVRLHVTESNEGAVALYRKLGFQVEQAIEHFAILK